MVLLQSIPRIQLLISIAGIIGAGVASYAGVRVAITEIRGQLRTHEKQFENIAVEMERAGRRLDRLEGKYFKD